MDYKGKSMKDYATSITSTKHVPVTQDCTPVCFKKYYTQKHKLTFTARASYRLGRHLNTSVLP